MSAIISVKPRVMVARAVFPEHLEVLRQRYDLRDNQADIPLDAAQMQAACASVEGALVTGSDRVDAAVIAAAPALRYLSTISVGYNHIDLAACTARGILVTNTPDVLTETTADMAWALLMAAARRITESEHWLRAGHWRQWSLGQMLGVDVHHATLGIVGMGRIGQAIARRAAGFAMRVVYHNRSRLPAELESACHATWLDLDSLLAEADHVMLVLPYSPSVHHLIDAPRLARMKRGATLVNIARGGLIDEDALADALATGHLFAAGLDVFEGEPQVNPRLLALPNIALAPHSGSATRATRDAMARLAMRNLDDAFAGRRPPNLLNPEVWRGG